MLPLILSLLLVLVISAFFAVSEMTILPLGETRVRALVEQRKPGAASLERVRRNPVRARVLMRLGAAATTVAAAVLAGLIGHDHVGTAGLVAGAVAAAVGLHIIDDILSSHIALRAGERAALLASPAILAIGGLIWPVLVTLERIGGVLIERPGVLGAVTESEIRELTAQGHTEGAIEEHERQLIERAFSLDDTKAWDIMTPRVDIVAWPDSLTLGEIASRLGNVPYSRIPVYGESIDDVTGVLYLRDAYQALLAGQRDVRLRVLAREPLIVPGSVAIADLLRNFQTRRIHLALVLDEYGGTDGLVTLEDVLEELVGEINDEMDVAEEPIIRISRSEIVAEGDADLREINHYFNTSLPQLEHRSLNGYLLEEIGHVPCAGETIEREGLQIEVLEATETQVVRARLRRLSSVPSGAASRGAAGTAASIAPEASPEIESERPAERVPADPSGLGTTSRTAP